MEEKEKKRGGGVFSIPSLEEMKQASKIPSSSKPSLFSSSATASQNVSSVKSAMVAGDKPRVTSGTRTQSGTSRLCSDGERIQTKLGSRSRVGESHDSHKGGNDSGQLGRGPNKSKTVAQSDDKCGGSLPPTGGRSHSTTTHACSTALIDASDQCKRNDLTATTTKAKNESGASVQKELTAVVSTAMASSSSPMSTAATSGYHPHAIIANPVQVCMLVQSRCWIKYILSFKTNSACLL